MIPNGDGILVITCNYVGLGAVYNHIKFPAVGTLFFCLLPGLSKSFTLPSDAITQNPTSPVTHPTHLSLWTNIKSFPWLFLKPSLYIKLQWFSSSHNLTRDNIHCEKNPSKQRPSTTDKLISHLRRHQSVHQLRPLQVTTFSPSLSLSLSP